MKSDSGSAPQAIKKWRLKRTLNRQASYRPIEQEDIRFIWAAYKKGALASMGFADESLTAEQFKSEFEKLVLDNFHGVWTLFAPTKKGSIPVGIVFAAWAPNALYMIVTGMCWFPWSSKRNKIEAMVGFLNGVRKELSLMFYALPEHKRLYEVCAMHGIVRRIGTSYSAIPDKASAVFETRAA